MSSNTSQYACYKDCLARRLLNLQSTSRSPEQIATADELDDFTSYLAQETWFDLPESIRNASYDNRNSIPDQDTLRLDSPAFADTLTSYGLVPDANDAAELLRKVLEDYIKEQTSPLPPWSATRTTACEICERDVPLTYHHLIPRSTHVKVIKKKWHPESMLNSVAWLCRPCHSAVHHVAPNETLAREYHTVDLLLQREDIQKWRNYAAKQRWGVKRG
ncbi:hypothetical protein PUNSTDRAFT_116630 [Punctularia strigosozonata HHB-11173 SS5]|uniref:HNH domain-containing protein n=1 Tax=Punctularia strigosozonata (strain HHB-11173) TaxID=741275 RepID=R7S2T6_PUNST|nr:uncharacterized protein PUNSTDRAFT_116630 [Punctularia strigosozonata HHB-11173 SS5]EIN04159.1 hypothetical protein PUNSTDRAFT_116630 [Punctularia strigosozonata HHB-11173 SS5]